jgi:hypothetical protein
MIGGLSLPAKNLNFWSPALQWGNLIAIPEAFFVQLADAVSHLCKALHKLVEKSLQPRPCCENHSRRHFDYEPPSSGPTRRESRLAREQTCGKYFPM